MVTTAGAAVGGAAAAMATLTLADVAKIVGKVKMYPYFDIANYILMCMMVREDDRPPLSSDPHHKPAALSRRHPLASYVSSMLMCFASVILVNFILGEPLIAPFSNHRDMLTASAVWYAINYSPFDIIYKLFKFTPFKVIIYCLKEVQRAHKVHHGIHLASHIYPGAYVVICVVGILKGAGYYYMRITERLVRGTWIPTSNEILQPTLATKACLVASILFILDDGGMFELSHHEIYLAVVAFFILGRLVYLLIGIHNPFLLLENLVCTLFFGGVVDAIRRLVSKQPAAGSATAPAKIDGDSSNISAGVPGQPTGGGSGAKSPSGKSKEE